MIISILRVLHIVFQNQRTHTRSKFAPSKGQLLGIVNGYSGDMRFLGEGVAN